MEFVNGRTLKEVLAVEGRLMPRRALEIAVPQINNLRDLLPAAAALSNIVLAGEASGREGADVARVLKAYMRAVELIDIEERVSELEEATRK